MFCKNCGREVPEGSAFCPECGTTAIGSVINMSNSMDVMEAASLNNGAEVYNIKHGRFEKAAVIFDKLVSMLGGLLALILGVVCWGEESRVLGRIIIFFAGVEIIDVIKKIVKPDKKVDEEFYRDKSKMFKLKLKLIIGVIVIAFICILVIPNMDSIFGGVISRTKEIVFDDITDVSVGEFVEENVIDAKWTKVKLASDKYYVYAKGFCPEYKKRIELTFYYYEDDDEYWVELLSISFPDNNEEYTSNWDIVTIWNRLEND